LIGTLWTTGAEAVEIVRPRLHHLAALGESLCLVVGGSNLVALRVRELQLDYVRRKALFVQCVMRKTKTRRDANG
jgi:hypothetical protein